MPRPIRILHITCGLNGGAGLGARRLHQALLASGSDSWVLCHSTAEDEAVPQVRIRPALCLADRIRRLPSAALHKAGLWKSPRLLAREATKEVRRKYGVTFYSGLSAFHLDREPIVQNADIVHLHWVGEFLDVPSFFRRVQKPIVWTLRDEWPLIGGFHYRTDAPASLPKWIADIDSASRRLKEAAFQAHRRTAFISLSRAMAEFARSTPIGAQRPVRVIPNPVNGDVFHPGNGRAIRSEFGIPDDAIVISFVAQRINDNRKGLADLISAAASLPHRDITLLCVGNGNPPTDVPPGIRIVCTGPVSDPARLASIYSASTLFAAPSKAESFGKTLTEALACGIPAVSYPNDGAKDIVRESDGVLSSDFSPESFRSALKEALSRSFDSAELRRGALSRFSPEAVARRHNELYSRLLGEAELECGLEGR